MRWTLPTILIALVTSVTTVSARFGFPEPVTERARTIEAVYVQIFIAALIVFIIVFAALAYVLWRYREGSGHGRNTFEKERDNLKAEMAWTLIPLLIVLWVGVISYQALVEVDDMDGSVDLENAMIIDITASQYAWEASYVDTGASVLAIANQDIEQIKPFYVRENTTMLFRVTALDVIHSFNLMQTATTVDAVPGQINELVVDGGLPAGEYFTQCKENCRTPGHSYMQMMFISVPDAEFEAWQEEVLTGGGAGQVIPVLYDAQGNFAPVGGDLAAIDTDVAIQVLNEGPARDFTVAGTTKSVDTDSLTVFELNLADPEDITVSADDGQQVTIRFIEPQVITIDLGNFVLQPDNLQLAAGGLYRVDVMNTHTVPHNLYIGMDGADGKTDAIWNTADLPGGASDSILIAPREAGTLDMWCAVAGHYSSGMFGTVTIA